MKNTLSNRLDSLINLHNEVQEIYSESGDMEWFNKKAEEYRLEKMSIIKDWENMKTALWYVSCFLAGVLLALIVDLW